MWIGLAVPALIITCNALHNYYPIFPTFSLRTSFNAFRGTSNGFSLQFNKSFPCRTSVQVYA